MRAPVNAHPHPLTRTSLHAHVQAHAHAHTQAHAHAQAHAHTQAPAQAHVRKDSHSHTRTCTRRRTCALGHAHTLSRRLLSQTHPRMPHVRTHAPPPSSDRPSSSSRSSGEHPSASAALAVCRRRVLSGVHLVLSGGLLHGVDSPQRCAYWRLAEAFGATCHLSWDADTPLTHVVSARADTASVKRALRTHGVHAVDPSWLSHSAERWCRQSEKAYSLKRRGAHVPHGDARTLKASEAAGTAGTARMAGIHSISARVAASSGVQGPASAATADGAAIDVAATTDVAATDVAAIDVAAAGAAASEVAIDVAPTDVAAAVITAAEPSAAQRAALPAALTSTFDPVSLAHADSRTSSLIPRDLSDSDRLLAALRFSVPSAQRHTLCRIAQQFERAASADSAATAEAQTRVLEELSELVGLEKLRALLVHLHLL
eukprot:6181458-Pleurochrysis_carterae.AAC.2